MSPDWRHSGFGHYAAVYFHTELSLDFQDFPGTRAAAGLRRTESIISLVLSSVQRRFDPAVMMCDDCTVSKPKCPGWPSFKLKSVQTMLCSPPRQAVFILPVRPGWCILTVRLQFPAASC